MFGQAPSAAAGLLGACSEVFSRWYSVMRDAVGRERCRQASFREQNGLPKSAKLPYVRPDLTEADRATASLSEAVIRAIAGDYPADYSREKFLSAIETGDKRAFKIRLLMLKVRDSILDPALKRDFTAGVERYIASAEERAGCKPDSSPRRLSKAEQERKKRLDAIRLAKKAREEAQLELPLVWPDDNKPTDPSTEKRQYIEKPSTKTSTENDIPIADVDNSVDSSTAQGSSGEYGVQYLERGSISGNQESQNIELGNGDAKAKPEFENVTVTHKTPKCNVTVTLNGSKSGVVRKARDYQTTDEIMDDIESGAIVPYESTEEILGDLESGTITQEEALLFAAALDIYCPEENDPDEIEGEDGDEDNEDGFNEDEGGDGEEPDEEEEGEDQDEDDDPRQRRGTGFSYNPNGFGGVDTEYVEDEW